MKKAFRIISVLLLVVMLGSSVVACTTKAPETTEQAPATTAPATSSSDIPEKLKEVIDAGGFDGEEIGIVVGGGDLANRSISVDTESEDYDATYSVNLAVDQRNKTVEQQLKVKLNHYREDLGGGLVNHIREYMAGPDSFYDIIGGYQYFDLGLAFGKDAGTLVNLSKLEEEDMIIDVEADYWDTESYNLLAYSGANFWITGDLSQTWLSTMFVSFVNKRIWTEYQEAISEVTGGITDPYQVVYQGKWTIDLWTELNEIVYKDLNTNEKVDDGDQVGFVGYSKNSGINDIVVDGLFSGCHVTFSKVDQSGQPSMNYNNKNLKAYSAATISLYNESKSLLLYDYVAERMVMHVFNDGLALMTINTLSCSEEYLADMEDDYYILPPPKANESQDDYYTTVGDAATQYGICSRTPNVQAATATLEALGYFSKKIVTPKYYDEALKGRYTRGDSVDAAKMIDFIREHIYNDFVLAWGNSMGAESPSWYLRKNIGSKSIETTAYLKESAWGKILNELCDKLEMGSDVEI